MRINLSSNVDDVIGWTMRLHPQFQYAAARALTDTVRKIEQALPAEAERAFDRPTVFTQRGYYFKPARKGSLVATVGIKDRQAQYLHWQVEGGQRTPARVALRLPSVVQLDAFGNVPAGLIRSLVARARAGKRVTRAQSRRFGVSQQVDLFYGEPGDGRPAGIYQRIVLTSTRHRLLPIIVFPKQSAQYSARRLDFYGFAERMALREFPPAMYRAWRIALATAR